MSSAGASGAPGTPWVTFLSDYGLEDHLVGVCKGVMAGVAPDARVIDVCHQVPPQNVAIGARLLAEAMPYLPIGVHLAMVDPLRPGVVRPVAIRCANGSTLVCPDNGVSSLAWERMDGVTGARELNNSALWHPKPVRSFRGRDIFAPVAAHLAAGLDFDEVGDPIPPADLVNLHPRAPYVHGDHVHGTVEMVDHFGNLQLNIARSDMEASGIGLGDTIELRYGGKTMQVLFTLSFGDVAPGRTFVYEDSFRAITVLTTMGRANVVLGAGPGDPIVLSRVQQSVIGPSAKVKVVDWPPSAGTA